MTAPVPRPRSARADGPDLLPLAPFLESLKADGIRTSLHDYERVHLALRTQGPWTPKRLRGTLAALLVQDEEQDRVLRRRFDQFFGLDEEKQAAFCDVDVERVLDDLRTLGQLPERTVERRGLTSSVRSRPPETTAACRAWSSNGASGCVASSSSRTPSPSPATGIPSPPSDRNRALYRRLDHP